MQIKTKTAALTALSESATPEQRAAALRLLEAEPAGSPARLREKSAASTPGVIDKDGTMLIRIIAPGKGSSGHYSSQVLERDIPRVFPKGTPMYANHMTESEQWERPERSINDLAGTFAEDPHWDEKGPAGPGSYTRVAVVEHWKPILSALAPHGIGTSIDADGMTVTNDDGTREVQAIVAGRSVDFVTRAGAGGTIIPLQEAARERGLPTPIHIEENEPVDKNDPALVAIQAQVTTLSESVTSLKTENAALLAEKRSNALREAARLAAVATLATVEMPELAKTKVLESVVSRAPVTAEGALDEVAFKTLVEAAATAEIAYAQSAFGFGTGNVAGNGGQAGAGTALVKGAPSKVMESMGPIRGAIGLA